MTYLEMAKRGLAEEIETAKKHLERDKDNIMGEIVFQISHFGYAEVNDIYLPVTGGKKTFLGAWGREALARICEDEGFGVERFYNKPGCENIGEPSGVLIFIKD